MDEPDIIIIIINPNKNILFNAIATIATDNIANAQNPIIPGLEMFPNEASKIVLKNEPTPLADKRIPRPAGPTLNISAAYTGINPLVNAIANRTIEQVVNINPTITGLDATKLKPDFISGKAFLRESFSCSFDLGIFTNWVTRAADIKKLDSINSIGPIPIKVISNPPKAGIKICIMLNAIEFKAIAFIKPSFGTTEDINENLAGSCIDQPNPINKTNTKILQVSIIPNMATIPKAAINSEWYI